MSFSESWTRDTQPGGKSQRLRKGSSLLSAASWSMSCCRPCLARCVWRNMSPGSDRCEFGKPGRWPNAARRVLYEHIVGWERRPVIIVRGPQGLQIVRVSPTLRFWRRRRLGQAPNMEQAVFLVALGSGRGVNRLSIFPAKNPPQRAMCIGPREPSALAFGAFAVRPHAWP